VDKVGQNLGTTQLLAGWRLVAATPPLAGLAGATVAALNSYKKNFLKNYQTYQIVQKCQLHKTTELNHANEASDSQNQGPRVDRLRH